MLQLQKALRSNSSMAIRVITNVGNRAYCKDYASSSDDEKEPKKKKQPKVEAKEEKLESAADKLNRLLASMQTEETLGLSKKSVNMARPGEGSKKRKEAAKKEANSKDVIAAAKNVAAVLGGDNEEIKKQTESELLAKLLGHKPEFSQSEEVKSDPNAKSLEEMSLSEIISGMKIDRSQHPKNPTHAEYVQRNMGAKKQQQRQQTGDRTANRFRYKKTPRREPEAFTGSVDLFGGEPLGIFTPIKDQLQPSEDKLKFWAVLHERELKMLTERPPANYYEKIALWTEQGKVWRFPIDNEQDWTDEINVDFSEHIFLEQHLDPWCPSKGPIRHFMELVCVGLSKNPYWTAKEKKEHILWYRDYFQAKKDILQDLMDEKKLQQKSLPSEQAEKQLEA